MRKLNKKSVTTAMLWVVIGLVLLAVILLVVSGAITTIMATLGNLLKQVFTAGLEKTFNPDSLYTLASDASFDRLNYEIAELLKDSNEDASIIIPYTLGQYRLVGFNKDKLVNDACIDDKMIPLKAQNCEGKGCLCLCRKEESCRCEKYVGVDYFVTIGEMYRNKGDKMPNIVEPSTGEDAYCLYLRGAWNEDGLKVIETWGAWWHSYNILIRKTVINGKTAILISRVQDLPGAEDWRDCDTSKLDTTDCDKISSCFNYQYFAMGCDWRYLCQNNICSSVNNLNCGILEIPETDLSEKEEVCTAEGKTLADICREGFFEQLPPGEKGERIYKSSIFQCFECLGVGAAGALESGWIDVPYVESDGSDCVS
jgi:hypothetical protein